MGKNGCVENHESSKKNAIKWHILKFVTRKRAKKQISKQKDIKKNAIYFFTTKW